MPEEKKLDFISTVNRALGMIEGVSCGLDRPVGACLVDAVQMIVEAMEEVFADEKV